MSCRVAFRPPPTHKQESGAKASRGGSAEGHRVKDQDRVYEKDIVSRVVCTDSVRLTDF